MPDFPFPLAGIDRTYGFHSQYVRQLDSGPIASCRDALNVRGYDVQTTRFRGASRPGLSKLNTFQVSGATWVTQLLDVIVSVGIPLPSGGTVQNSQSGRVVFLVAVSQGKVYTTAPGDTVWTAATNATINTPPLNFSGIMYSASNIQKLWIVDGTNAVYFDPVTNTVYPWIASAGAFPLDSQSNLPRLICTWRGRTVLSGLPRDPQNWFMSAVKDPTNFLYNPTDTVPTRAVAGNNAPAGLIGDVVNCMIPYSDDVLIFGGDSSIYLMAGDPCAGGQIDRVTDAIGMAWGMPWAKDPAGTVYFFANRPGIYSMVPGREPVRISQGIEQLILDINTGTNAIRMLWNDRLQGLHVFVTPVAAKAKKSAPAQHYFWEQRTQAWWIDEFASPNFDPLCCTVFDGNLPGDRVAVIGCWDGYVRKIDPFVFKDDGLPIESFVVLGPIDTPNLDSMTLHDLQAVIGETSGNVDYKVYVGATAEQALNNAHTSSGVWVAGRNPVSLVRKDGHAVYLKLSSSNVWAMEQIRARVTSNGKVRMRGSR